MADDTVNAGGPTKGSSQCWRGWSKSEWVGELAEALAKAQGAFGVLKRKKAVEVKTRTGGVYSFRYAPLDDVIALVKKPLSDNGLSFVQVLDTNDTGVVRIKTILMHSSGQWIMSTSPIYTAGGGNQDFGSALTYQRRYALCALLGLAGEEDDDANIVEAATVHEQEGTQEQEKAQKPAGGVGPVEMAYALARKIQVSEEEMDEYIAARFNGKMKHELSPLQGVSLKQTIERIPTRSAFIDELDQWRDIEKEAAPKTTTKNKKTVIEKLIEQGDTDATAQSH